VALAEADLIELPVPAMVVLFGGALGPTVAALWGAHRESGAPAIGALLRTLVHWRVPPVWYGVALVGPALVVLAAVGLGLAVGSPLLPAPPISAWLNVPVMLLVFILLASIEELGWRVCAPSHADSDEPLRASLLLGIAWGFWHAAQWFIPETGQAGCPFPAFLVWVLALSILFSFIYNGIRGGVLLVLLAHAATNAFQGPWTAALATLPESARGVDPRLLVVVPQVALSALIVVLTRGRPGLQRRPRCDRATWRSSTATMPTSASSGDRYRVPDRATRSAPPSPRLGLAPVAANR
jgi:hypothetical protein